MILRATRNEPTITSWRLHTLTRVRQCSRSSRSSYLQAGRERLAPNMRSHVAVLPKKLSDDNKKDVELVFLSKGSMKDEHRVQILDAAMKTKDMDNEHFLATVRSRLDRCAALQVPLQQHIAELCLCAQDYTLHTRACLSLVMSVVHFEVGDSPIVYDLHALGSPLTSWSYLMSVFL